MMFKWAINFMSCLLLGAQAASISPRQTRGSLQQVTDFGSNLANVGFYIYVPNNLAQKPGIVVAIHYCTGTSQAYFDNTPYRTHAEQYGFIVIYPNSPHEGSCWDVSSNATLTRNGGGDSTSIANMALWTKRQFKADPHKIFVTGTSSGAMMTNVLSATYPDLFQAAIVHAGVPAGCFMSSYNGVDAWNSTCAQGQSINTPAVWADVVHKMYPGYTGSYPRIQIYHGGADTALLPQNYIETVKQWSAVWGYDIEKPKSVQNDSPESGWTRTAYGCGVQGIFHPNVTHSIPLFGAEDMKWFGFAAKNKTGH